MGAVEFVFKDWLTDQIMNPLIAALTHFSHCGTKEGMENSRNFFKKSDTF
ncbi:MAG: hypothetical protein GY820_08090 [Gammaproteobacteria bacterium]|nr:hypothetical protein [Gammaproteobacteria bacterium]